MCVGDGDLFSVVLGLFQAINSKLLHRETQKSSYTPPLFFSVPVSCTKIYSRSSGMRLPFKTLSHSYPCARGAPGSSLRCSVPKQDAREGARCQQPAVSEVSSMK